LDPPVVQCAVLGVTVGSGTDRRDLILFTGPDESGPSGKGRSDLRVRYSTDQAKTWRDGPLIHEGPAAYSDLVQLPGGDVGILFEAGLKGKKRYDRILFQRFDPAVLTP
jgi:sialidase-1